MPGQSESVDKGGTLRLGSLPLRDSRRTRPWRAATARTQVWERHRHRYELEQRLPRAPDRAGLTLSGLSPDGKLVEAVELGSERFFVGVQYHPEFKSRPNRPHPLFTGFISAALKK